MNVYPQSLVSDTTQTSFAGFKLLGYLQASLSVAFLVVHCCVCVCNGFTKLDFFAAQLSLERAIYYPL